MQPAQSNPVDYRGTRHARLTKSMKALPSSPLKVLVELRYMLADNQTGIISNAVLAKRTGLSEGYISPCVRWLAGDTIGYMPQFRTPLSRPFIQRTKAEGQGYHITMLPPPDQRTTAALPPKPAACPEPPTSEQLTLWGDHACDPQPEVQTSAPGSDEPHESGDHAHDPSIFYIHTDQQQQHASADTSTDQERPAEVWTDALWAQMRVGTPGYSRARFYADKAKLLNRPGYNVGMIIQAAINGQPVQAGKDRTHGAGQRPSGTPTHQQNTSAAGRSRYPKPASDRRVPSSATNPTDPAHATQPTHTTRLADLPTRQLRPEVQALRRQRRNPGTAG